MSGKERGRPLALALSVVVPAAFYFHTCSRTIGATDDAVPLHFEWRGPDGTLAYANEPGVAPSGTSELLAELGLPERQRPRGLWQVPVWSRGEKAAAFTLR